MNIEQPIYVNGFEVPLQQKEVTARTGYSRFQILRIRKSRNFPDPIDGGYLWSEILAWQQKLKEVRNIKTDGDREKNLALLKDLKNQLAIMEKRLAA